MGKNYFVRAGLGSVYVLSANEERVGFIEEVAYSAVSLQTRRLGSFNLLYSLGIRKELKKGWKLGLHYSRELFTWDYEQNPVGGLITNIWSFRVSKRIASKANAE